MITILELIIMIMIKMMIMTTMIILIIRWRRRKRLKGARKVLPLLFQLLLAQILRTLPPMQIHVWRALVSIFGI